MFKCFLFSVCLSAFVKCYSQDTIYWNSQSKLSWNDFKGVPDTALQYEALTFSGIHCKFMSTDTTFSYQVMSYFLKQKSWRMPYADSVALKHEQLHFDISELFARKLSEALYKLNPSIKNIQETANALFKETVKKQVIMQDEYDEDTDFGRIASEQDKWEKKIACFLR